MLELATPEALLRSRLAQHLERGFALPAVGLVAERHGSEGERRSV